jgi:hypothetical protein
MMPVHRGGQVKDDLRPDTVEDLDQRIRSPVDPVQTDGSEGHADLAAFLPAQAMHFETGCREVGAEHSADMASDTADQYAPHAPT